MQRVTLSCTAHCGGEFTVASSSLMHLLLHCYIQGFYPFWFTIVLQAALCVYLTLHCAVVPSWCCGNLHLLRNDRTQQLFVLGLFLFFIILHNTKIIFYFFFRISKFFPLLICLSNDKMYLIPTRTSCSSLLTPSENA